MDMSTRFDNWSTVSRRGVVIAITAAMAVITALAASALMPRIYEATTEFYLSSEAQAFGVLSRSGGSAAPVLTKEIQKWVVAVLESAALRDGVHRSVQQKPAAALMDDVDVDVSRNHIIRISVRDRDPQVAATVANVYPGALRDFLRGASAVRGQRTTEALEGALAEVDRELAETRLKMQSLLADERSPNMQIEIQKLLDRRSFLENDVEKTRARLKGIEQRIAAATLQLKEEATRRGALFSQNQVRLIKDISDLEADLAAARIEFDGQFSGRHPKVRALTVRLERKRAELEQELAALQDAEVKPADSFYEQLRRELQGLYKDRSAVAAEIISSTRSLDALAARIGKLPPGMLREQELTTDTARLESMRDSLRQRQREMRTLAATVTSPVVVVATATVPGSAKYPLPWLNALVAAVLGLVAGIYMAFAHDNIAGARAATPQ